MKTVIEMAHEAGFDMPQGESFYQAWPEEIERFAELVRADERRAMMQLFTDPENQPTQHGTVTVNYMQREIADEREACAKVCDALDAMNWSEYGEYSSGHGYEIRKRGIQ